MKIILYLISFAFFFSSAKAFHPGSDSVNCKSPESHQFDFWIGDWSIQQKILQKDGTWLETEASTSVSPIFDGCALEEHWEGKVKFFWLSMDSVESMKGFSLRYYSVKDSMWHIYWLDNKSLEFGKDFSGNFKDGKGEFFSERTTPHGKQISRIVFSKLKPNSVHWDLAYSNDAGKNWTTIWIMEMSRK